MLRDILVNLQDALGVSGDRARLVRFINQAYREYYERTDLSNSLFEQSFEFNVGDQLITLPWYVEQVRAMRRVRSNDPVRLLGPAPRYHNAPWLQSRAEFYVLGRRAIHTPLSIESPLTVTIPLAQSVPFTVTIKGQTPSAASVTEKLSFAAGDTSKTTTTQFAKDDPIGIETISRYGEVTADIQVADAAGTVICTIPNTVESPQHIVVQWNNYDAGAYNTTDNIIEVLYKRVFTPLINDSDETIFPAIDNAILWKARGYYASLSKDELAGTQAMACEQKADNLFSQAIECRELETVQIAKSSPMLEQAWTNGRFNTWNIRR